MIKNSIRVSELCIDIPTPTIVALESMCEDLAMKLQKGVSHFVYVKKDGEQREAFGTKNPFFIPNTRLTEGVVKQLQDATDNLITSMNIAIEEPAQVFSDPDGFRYSMDMLKEARVAAFGNPDTSARLYTPNEDYVNYYDFDSKGWRKFKKDSLIIVY